MEIIDVNKKGRSSDGETYNDMASPHAIAMGYMINVPVLLRYPNGRTEKGNKLLVTPKGMEYFQKQVGMAGGIQ